MTEPVIGTVDGQRVLVYELTVTNYGNTAYNLTGLRLRDERGNELRDWSMEELYASYLHKRVAGRLPPGAAQTLLLWVPLSDQSQPGELRHQFTFGEDQVDSQPLKIRPLTLPQLSLPFSLAGRWVAANGPSNGSGHRGTILGLQGIPYLSQRWAIDWMIKDDQDRTYRGDPLDNRSYFCYGADVLAVAQATVIAVQDGIPENVPGANSRAVPMDLETLGGNCVNLDLGGGCYARYAHLIPGSIQVKVGDRVHRGQVLGKIGNSGNSGEPHLHFHVADQPPWLPSQGLPYLLQRYRLARPGQEAEIHVGDLPGEGQAILLP